MLQFGVREYGCGILCNATLAGWQAELASAVTGGAEVLISEDMSHGQVIDGAQIRNPFLQ